MKGRYKDVITAKRVREMLRYDPDTGLFTWLVSRRGTTKVGDVAGGLHPSGYLIIGADGYTYMAHRLAWLHVHGSWPVDQIDHVNGARADNRLSNLREATPAENQQNKRKAQKNNKSGFLGVFWREHRKKWVARIGVNHKHIHIGYFHTAELAHQAYLSAKRDLHPACTILMGEKT